MSFNHKTKAHTFPRAIHALLSTAFLLSCINHTSAEAGETLVPKGLLAAAENHFKGLHTVEYRCRMETADSNGRVVRRETLHYIESSKGYRWEKTVDPGASGSHETSIAAYDGVRSMTFDSVTGIVYTKAIPDEVASPPALVPRGPLEPFAFLRNQKSVEANQMSWPELRGFASDNTWRHFANTVTSAGIADKPSEVGLQLEAPGGLLKGFQAGPTSLRVTFSEENGLYPVAWERHWLDSGHVLAYKVETFGAIERAKEIAWRYPVLAKIESYNPKDERVPRFTTSIKTDEVKINADLDEDALTIDPAIGTYVYDLDEEAMITIPR